MRLEITTNRIAFFSPFSSRLIKHQLNRLICRAWLVGDSLLLLCEQLVSLEGVSIKSQCLGSSDLVVCRLLKLVIQSLLSPPSHCHWFNQLVVPCLLLSEEKGSRGRSIGSHWPVSKRSAEWAHLAQTQTWEHLIWGVSPTILV